MTRAGAGRYWELISSAETVRWCSQLAPFTPAHAHADTITLPSVITRKLELLLNRDSTKG